MNLRLVAEEDLAEVLEDDVDGFGWSMTVIDPSGLSMPLIGSSTDIGQLIDPETGTLIAGRSASATLRISSLVAAGFATLPRGIMDPTSKPWRVDFLDINGNLHNLKVQHSYPDRTLGIVVCMLEMYAP